MEWSFSFELCTCWHHIKAKKLCSYYLLLIKYSDSVKWQQWSRWKGGSVCYYSSRVMIIVTFKVTQHKTVIFHFYNNGISTTVTMRFEIACFLSLKYWSKKHTLMCQMKIYRIMVIKKEKCFTINWHICHESIFTYRQLLTSYRNIDYCSSSAFFLTEINIEKMKRR